jgi:hypothetical protein
MGAKRDLSPYGRSQAEGVENRVLRRIYRPKKENITGDWRKLHNVELRNVYSSLDIVVVTTSRRMNWADI